MQYPAKVLRKGDGYTVTFPDIPEAITRRLLHVATRRKRLFAMLSMRSKPGLSFILRRTAWCLCQAMDGDGNSKIVTKWLCSDSWKRFSLQGMAHCGPPGESPLKQK